MSEPERTDDPGAVAHPDPEQPVAVAPGSPVPPALQLSLVRGRERVWLVAFLAAGTVALAVFLFGVPITGGAAVVKGGDATETAVNTTLTLVALVKDKLGNLSRVRMTGAGLDPAATLGIDKTAPTFAFNAGSVAADAIFTVARAANWVTEASDNLPVSGPIRSASGRTGTSSPVRARSATSVRSRAATAT